MVRKKVLYNIKTITWLVVITEVVIWATCLNIYFFIFNEEEGAPRFEHPEYLWFLLAIPFFSVFWVYNTIQKNKVIQRYASSYKLSSLNISFSDGIRFFQYFCARNAMFFLIIALCNLQYGTGKDVKTTNVDVMIALDISNSMLAEDMPNGNRLTNAKRAIEKLISQLKGDRIGLVVFAGDAFVQIPITDDYGAAKLFLGAVSTDMLSAQGTAIGRAIDKATQSFDMKANTKKAIIVISDGENHEDDAQAAARSAVNNGIKIYTIGVGSVQGSPIPLYQDGVKEGVMRDAEGNTIITKLNQQMLIDLAETGKGVYIKTNKSNFGLDRLFNEINKTEKETVEIDSYHDYEDQYFYFLWVAFAFIIAEFILAYLPVL